MKKLRLRSLLILSIFLGLCFSPVLYSQTIGAYWPDDNWRVSTPEEQGVDSQTLLDMFKDIQSSNLDFHSILIIRNGYLITEAYRTPYHKETTHNIKSASKSVISALTGIAIKKKYIKTLEQKVSEFFPEYANEPQKKDITLRNMLTMTGGISWNENAKENPFDLENWKRLPMSDKPGERFVYNTMMPHMMSAILTKTSGMSTRDFANDNLFKPIGIKNFQWKKDDIGYYYGGAELFLTPRDMARFGFLFLNKGLWNGQQIIPVDWVEESTTAKIDVPPGLSYAYWWWIPAKGYMAWGFGGQYIIVRPDLNLVVVITANGADKINLYKDFMESFLEKNIFKAVKGYKPLPSNSLACQFLKEHLQKLENPEAVPIPTMPKTASKISGRNYILEQNKMNLKSFALTFKNTNECFWKLNMGKDIINFQVSLDGKYRITNTGLSLGGNPEENQSACKGYWKSDSIFVIEHHMIGDPTKQIFELKFAGNKVAIGLSTFGFETNILTSGTMEK